MECECKLPCIHEPVTEADACFCTAFLFLCASISIFVVYNGYQVVLWLPLAGCACLWTLITRHYETNRLSNRPDVATPILNKVTA
jgi:hypothetical protein